MIFFNKNKKTWLKAKQIIKYYKLLKLYKNDFQKFKIIHKIATYNKVINEVVQLIIKKNPL